jgi:drug/metabolite transporter (DMT)-like permease
MLQIGNTIQDAARRPGLNAYSLAGALAIMLAALFWSIDGLFIRPRFYILPAELVVFWEHFFGLIVLSPFIFLNWHKIKQLSRPSWGALIWISVFGGALGTIMITKAFFAALDGQISFATVVILQKLQPVFALLLARVLLREKLPRPFYFWAIIAIGASYFIAFGQSGLDFAGIDWRHSAALWAVLAAFAFGSSTVFGKRIANHLDYKIVAALRFGLTAILVLALAIATGAIRQSSQLTAAHWGLLGLIVLTSGAGAMGIYYFGLRRVSASAATILELFWPFSALILDYVFNHNYLNYIQIAAFIVLLFAFYKIYILDKLKPVVFRAKVIGGSRRGRVLGYPTANLDQTDLDIPHGVYIVAVKVDGKDYAGLMHFGFKDVFDEPVSLEVLIKDFSEDIYGRELAVTIIKKIREVKKFADAEELSAAIKDDLRALDAALFIGKNRL